MPTRSVLVSFTITVAALVTVVVFGSNLRALETEYDGSHDDLIRTGGRYATLQTSFHSPSGSCSPFAK